jgi:hypothetical protein
MSRFEESEMKTAITISMAMALSVAAMVPTSAQVAPIVPPVSSPSVGPWIVGGIGLGVLSVIGHAGVVSDREKRELTSDEATLAIFLPFAWVFFSPEPGAPKSDTIRLLLGNLPNMQSGFGAQIKPAVLLHEEKIEIPSVAPIIRKPMVKSTVRRRGKAGIK